MVLRFAYVEETIEPLLREGYNMYAFCSQVALFVSWLSGNRRKFDFLHTDNMKAYFRKGGITMARKSKKDNDDGSNARSPRPNAVVWGNVYLTDADVENLEREQPTPDVLFGAVAGVVLRHNAGFSLKSPIDADDGYGAFFIFNHFGSEGNSVGLSAWSNSPERAIAALLYKWFNVLGEVEPEVHPTRPNRNFR
jgi:hypothetical protein